MCKDFGLLSGKYDSTKQRAVLLQGDRLRNYRRYNATIRMEMLIAGGITVTDAQFYDGLYFAWMTEDKNQFDEFLECISDFSNRYGDRKIFKIMQRAPDYNVLATSMFCKQFFFSSLEPKELADFVNAIGEDYSIAIPDNTSDSESILSALQKELEKLKGENQYKIELTPKTEMLREREPDFESYLQYMKNCIKCTYGEIYQDEWNDFFNRIKKMFKGISSKKLYEVWEPKNNGGYRGFKYREFLSENFDSNHTYQNKMDEILEEFQELIKNIKLSNKYFTLIRTETLKSFPIRSKIVEYFNKIFELISDNSENININEAQRYRLKYIKLFNDRYNKAIAYQHHSKFIDVCDYNENVANVINNLKDSIEVFDILLSPEMVKNLGRMRWQDFYKIISDCQVVESYNQLCCAYDNQDIDCKNFKEILGEYIALIGEKINNTNIQNDGNVGDGPWNYHDTNIFALYDKFFSKVTPPSFIGGGSYVEGKEANEICLFRDCGKKSLYRLKISNGVPNDIHDDSNSEFDTVIAPVKNIFNGEKS